MERILCFGARDWDDLQLIWDTLEPYRLSMECLIEGECRGADRMSRFAVEQFASEFGTVISVLRYPADWTRFGKGAGPIRNQQMILEGHPTLGICFHDSIETSKGSKDMLNRLQKANIPVKMIKH